MKMLNYKIFNKSQGELQSYLISKLNNKKIPYQLIDGNIVSLRFKGFPIFVAHMDTVEKADGYKIPLIVIEGKLKRLSPAILGGDDRAGINLIVNNMKKINFIFTRDEEIGLLGAKSLMKNQDFKDFAKDYGTCFVELDRKGTTDIIGTKSYLCDKDLEEKVNEILPTYSPARGVLSDINQLKEILPSVNLSVGYFNAHKNTEYLEIDHFKFLNSKILDLNKGLSKQNFKEAPTPPPITPYKRNKMTIVGYCDRCFNSVNMYYKYSYVDTGEFIFCRKCAKELAKELIELL